MRWVPRAIVPERGRGLLPARFYRRDVDAVARDLVGRWLVRGDVVVRITEVEAYGGRADTACHASRARTPRNEPMWHEGGIAYVYLCYGLHVLLNVVTGDAGDPCAVLLRAGEPIAGLDTIAARRGGRRGPESMTGPGRLGAALALSVDESGTRMDRGGPLALHRGVPLTRVARGPRIGIDWAGARDRDALRRYADPDSTWVSQRHKLRSTIAV